MVVEVKMEGLGDVTKKLQTLSNKNATKRVSRKAARQAMIIVRDAARQAAKAIDDPNTPNKIHKEIVVKLGRSRDANSIVMRVGVRGGARIPYTNNSFNRRNGRVGSTYQVEGKVWYWRLIEFGRGAVVASKDTKMLTDGQNFFGKDVGPVPAKPFMRPALQNNIQAATNKFAEVFSAELDKELAKL